MGIRSSVMKYIMIVAVWVNVNIIHNRTITTNGNKILNQIPQYFLIGNVIIIISNTKLFSSKIYCCFYTVSLE